MNGTFPKFYETRRCSLSQNKEEAASEEPRRLLRRFGSSYDGAERSSMDTTAS